MCRVNGEPRKEALAKLTEVLKETPPAGPRACLSLIALNGLSTLVLVLNAPCPISRHRASKVLQEVVAFGHADKILACKNWLFQVQRNLGHDNADTRASGAALLRVMPVSPECVTAIPLLLQSLKVESAPAREESAGALLQLSLDKVCREEMGNGAFIQEVIHHFKYNASMIVRGRLSALLAALARTSSRHRVKIINNEGMNVLLEALDPQFSDAIVDNALVSLQHVLGGARTARPF